MNKDLLKILKSYVLVPLCPEQLGGLSTPRPPAEIIGDKVININGFDVTEYFLRGAKEALKFAMLYDVKFAILKDGSPSCGTTYIYDGTFSDKKIPDRGITASIFIKNGIKVYSEKQLEEFLKNEEYT